MATMMRDSYNQEEDPNTANFGDNPEEYSTGHQPLYGQPYHHTTILGNSIAGQPVSPGRVHTSVMPTTQSIVYPNHAPPIMTHTTVGMPRPSQYQTVTYTEYAHKPPKPFKLILY